MKHRGTHNSRQPTTRTGVTTIEFAFVFSVFLFIVLGFFELGVMLVRHNLLADAAERVLREATVRGSESAAQQWGPAEISTNGSDSMINGVITPSVVMMAANQIQVDVQWPDGNNRPGSRVRVSLSYQHNAIVPYVWGADLLTLQAGCEARVSH